MAKSNNDILSVMFLALICIVFAGIVHRLAPENSLLIIPSFAVIAVGLWIAYDSMLLNRYESKVKCLKAQHNMESMEELAKEIYERVEDDDNVPEEVQEVQEVQKNSMGETSKASPIPRPQKENDDEFDIDMYNESRTIEQMHRDMASPGDNKLCNRMKYMGLQAQLSQNIRSEWNKYSLQPFLEEELAEHADREWWNSDYLEDQM
jgi:hypothetical protein